MVKTIIFDLGGVVITLDQPQAIKRFRELGLNHAERWLDAYTQQGIFGELESGKIDAVDFRLRLSKLVGKELRHMECLYGWLGYVREVPRRNLDMMRRLMDRGYRVLLLSNTNPYMMEWARSTDFSGDGHPLDYYVNKMYLSYELKMMKPDPAIFREVLNCEKVKPENTLFVDDGERNIETARELGFRTFRPENGRDWTREISSYLR